jgi:hypothetical protein
MKLRANEDISNEILELRQQAETLAKGDIMKKIVAIDHGDSLNSGQSGDQ